MSPVVPSRPRGRTLTEAARRSLVVVAATAGLASVGTGPMFAATVTAPLSCGATISNDTTLANDLHDCSGDGLIVGADNITLDLNGHVVDGDAVPGSAGFDVGIRVAGRHGVVISGGTVSEFDLGIGLSGSTGNTIRAMHVHDTQRRGIELAAGSNDNVVRLNTSALNTRSGFALIGSDGNLIAGNLSDGNGLSGIVAFGGSRNRILGNVVVNNGDEGIGLNDGSNDNLVDGNRLADDSFAGIQTSSERNVITNNSVTRTGGGVLIGGHDNVVRGNTITGGSTCDGCGIGIQVGDGSGAVIVANRISGQARYGIEVDGFLGPGNPTVGTTIRDNTVRDSGIGIAIGPEEAGPVEKVVIDGNLTAGSAGDGIFVAGAATGVEATRVSNNVAVRNGELGIDALPGGAIDGGGNHAAANGDPRECLNIACS